MTSSGAQLRFERQTNRTRKDINYEEARAREKIVRHDGLIAQYENPIEHACGMKLGQVFVCNGWARPDGFCDSAWDTVSPFVLALAHGGENFYDGWMKNPKSAMISCNDGFRPVSFLLETLDEDAES